MQCVGPPNFGLGFWLRFFFRDRVPFLGNFVSCTLFVLHSTSKVWHVITESVIFSAFFAIEDCCLCLVLFCLRQKLACVLGVADDNGNRLVTCLWYCSGFDRGFHRKLGGWMRARCVFGEIGCDGAPLPDSKSPTFFGSTSSCVSVFLFSAHCVPDIHFLLLINHERVRNYVFRKA